MERQLLIVLTVILMAAGCQQLPVNSPNTNEINYDIPTDDPDPNLYTSASSFDPNTIYVPTIVGKRIYVPIPFWFSKIAEFSKCCMSL